MYIETQEFCEFKAALFLNALNEQEWQNSIYIKVSNTLSHP